MESTKNTLPAGYIRCVDSVGLSFAVPQYLVPAAHTSFDAFRQKGSVNNQILHEVRNYHRFLLRFRYIIYFLKASKKTWINFIAYQCRYRYDTHRPSSFFMCVSILHLMLSVRVYVTRKYYHYWPRPRYYNKDTESL